MAAVRNLRRWIRNRAWAGLLAGGLAAALVSAGGCGVPTENVVVGADGQAIRLTTIMAIRNDANLTTEEKRQALRDLGISDETLIDVLLG